jgi:hypothetical protein
METYNQFLCISILQDRRHATCISTETAIHVLGCCSHQPVTIEVCMWPWSGRPAGRRPAAAGSAWRWMGRRPRSKGARALLCSDVLPPGGRSAGRPAGQIEQLSSSWLTRTQRQHPIHPPVPRSFSPRPKSFRSSEFDRDGRRHIMRGSESSNS